MISYRYQIAEERHVPEVLALLGTITDDPTHGSKRLPDPAAAAAIWRRMRESKQVHLIVAITDKGKVIGSCVLSIVPNFTYNGKSWGAIEHVVTHPHVRGQGVGSSMLQWSFNFAKQQGCYKVNLLSGDTPEQRRFYERLGFESKQIVGYRKYL